MTAVGENLNRVKSSIPSSVTLVAVSKLKGPELIMQAYEAGQRHYGENYVQELTTKYSQLPKDICWHFIGHLQSNKVKYIAPFVHLIHGIDSFKLLTEVNKQAQKHNRIIHCLLQVYIAREETKFGLDFNEVETLLSSPGFAALHNVKVTGLMGMATNTADIESVKEEFKSLAAFAKHLQSTRPPSANFSLQHLSMGMSGDYREAIACGSNMIRIGSSIFGERN